MYDLKVSLTVVLCILSYLFALYFNMSNLSHRTTKHTRYSLRRQLPSHANSVLQQTAKQRLRQGYVRHIARTWPITRGDKSSRGLVLRRSCCFRNSALQALMHVPRFLNWILSHNETISMGVVRFPCRSHDEIQAQMEAEAMPGRHEVSHGKTKLRDCPACAMKQFVIQYWGNRRDDSTHQLEALDPASDVYNRLVQIDRALMQYTPQAGEDGSEQDPEEFQSRFLQACLESVDHRQPEQVDWAHQYAALFDLDMEVTWTCECGALQPLPFGTVEAENRMALSIEGKKDSVKASVQRRFTPEKLGDYWCVVCDRRRNRTKRVRIDAAPEILRVRLNIANEKGRRNNDPIHINERLDLTDYEAVEPGHASPLMYRLRSILYHKGSQLSGGHWYATVRGPMRVYEVNDSVVIPLRPSQLCANPHKGAQAVVLMYQRLYPRTL